MARQNISLVSLQASNSMWFLQEPWLLQSLGPNIGPLLLSVCCIITAAMCLLTRRIVKRIGCVYLIIAHYISLCVFLLIHLYPSIWFLVPAYIMLGLTLGPAWVCKWNLVVFFASRVSCGQHECNNTTIGESIDDHKMFCNRDERVRRLARWFHAVQDIGIFGGALIASIVIACAATETGCFSTSMFFKNSIRFSFSGGSDGSGSSEVGTAVPNVLNETETAITLNATQHNGIENSHLSRSILRQTTEGPAPSTMTRPFSAYEYYQNAVGATNQRDEMLLDTMFNTNEHGERICGAGSCPVWNYETLHVNATEINGFFEHSGTLSITVFYLMLAVAAVTLAYLSQPVDSTVKYDSVKGMTDTLLLAAPMAYFIGTEQSYVLGGFTKVS